MGKFRNKQVLFRNTWAKGALYESIAIMGTQNESVMDWQCWVPDSERLVCKSERSVWEPSEQVPGVREGTMILVDWGICRIHMVPTWLKAKTGTSVSGAPRIHRQEPLPPRHPHRERNTQWTFVHCLFLFLKLSPHNMWVYL